MVRNHEGETGFRGWQPRDRTGSAAMSIRGSGRSEGMSVEGGHDTRTSRGCAGRKVCKVHLMARAVRAKVGMSGRIPREEVGFPTRATGEHSEGGPRRRVRTSSHVLRDGREAARHRRKTSKTRRATGKVREGAGKTNDPLRRPRVRRTSHLTMTGQRTVLAPGQPHESLRRCGAAQVASAWRKACLPSIL